MSSGNLPGTPSYKCSNLILYVASLADALLACHAAKRASVKEAILYVEALFNLGNQLDALKISQRVHSIAQPKVYCNVFNICPTLENTC